MKCIKLNTKKYRNRPSPACPAKTCKGKTMKGNDGRMYVSKANRLGVYRWVPKASGRKASFGIYVRKGSRVIKSNRRPKKRVVKRTARKGLCITPKRLDMIMRSSDPIKNFENAIKIAPPGFTKSQFIKAIHNHAHEDYADLLDLAEFIGSQYPEYARHFPTFQEYVEVYPDDDM